MPRPSVFGVVIALCLLPSCLGGTSAPSKNVKATLKTQWEGFPMTMEATEFFSEESDEDYWNFLSELATVPRSSDEAEYNHLVSAADRILQSEQKLGLFKMALAINYYNPRLQMFAHLAESSLVAMGHYPRNTSAWIHFAGKAFFSWESLLPELASSTADFPEVERLPFDHIHPASKQSAPAAVLYAEPGSEVFAPLHAALASAAQAGQVKYILRPFTANRLGPVAVQGYGVELAIKSLEYKVMDTPTAADEEADMMLISDDDSEEDVQGFLFKTLSKRFPSLTTELNQLRETLLSSDDAVDNLSKWEFRDLGLQAMQHISNSEDPIRALRDVSQNLPSLAPLLSKLKRTKSTMQQIEENGRLVEEGTNVVLINGQPVDADADVFALFALLRRQVNKYESLRKLEIARSSVFDLLSLPNPQRITPRIQLNSDYVFWLNNLESDSMYRGWPGSVRDILRPTFPNQLHFIAKNIFNLLCVVDLTEDQYVEWVNTMLALIYRNQAPLRFGILPLISGPIKDLADSEIDSQPLSLAIAKVFLHFLRDHNTRAATNFLQHFVGQPRVTSIERLREVFDTASGNNWENVMGNKFNEHLRSISSLLEDSGIVRPIALLNGFVLDIPSPNQFTNQVANELFRQRREIQEWVHKGEITDNMEIYDWLLQQDGFPTYNPAIFPSSQSPERYLSLTEASFRSVLKQGPYFTASDSEASLKKLTHVLLVDSQNQAHIEMVRNILQLVRSSGSESRVAVFGCNAESNYLGRLIAALDVLYPHEGSSYVHPRSFDVLLDVLASWADVGSSLPAISATISKADSAIDIANLHAAFNAPETSRSVEQHAKFCQHAMSGNPSGVAIVTNGRVFSSVKPFGEADFSVIEAYELKSRVHTVASALTSISFDGVDYSSVSSEQMSNLILFVSATTSSVAATGDSQRPSVNPDIQSSFESRNLDSAISIVAVLDPLGAPAQRFASTLLFLREYLDPDTRVVLSPRTSVSDLPLKNFYRLKLEPIAFDHHGKKVSSSNFVLFSGLPQRKLLTMNLHPPAPWLVEAVSCKHDLDNILLAQLPPHESSLAVTFELNHILVEGSCSDESNGGVPPRGLQLNLGDDVQPHRVDTLVMSNLGYFQLKASPGVWTLKLAEGRASDIYQINSPGGVKKVILSDWIPLSHTLSVEKKPEKLQEPLFLENEAEEENGILGGVLGGLFGGKKASTKDAGETINVFSLASGHLYERFLKIMMLSVVKKTDRPVKFWLLKNFLSPAFKEFIPHMAKAHNFSVELVTYKWPAWLWPQTEKQRIIWGYKILFLDVLFPLGVKKVIYVDADQVVRTDLKELWEMDLKGAPYGYTPFCSGEMANPSTKGFRFWDNGFWADHLQGKPYHISALYVVDLVRFRAIAAGDRLRATYDSLARDPNSLANLDQDLPNYMQHHVPIFSLPREWLWCETWCSGGSKANAKTIDLCNNPLTKTPKLDAAVQILPEWTGLDSEVKAVERAFAEQAQV